MDIQQTKTLRIVADGDSSGYVTARNAMATADKAASAAAKGVEVAVTSSAQKISQSGDVISQLQRKYVEGARQAQSFGTEVAKLGRALETGRATTADAVEILEAMASKLGLTANAAQIAATGNIALSRAVEQVNARLAVQRSGVDALTASYQRMAAEARAAQAADHAQDGFNRQIGVRPVSTGAAAKSAAAFSSILDRQEELARQRAQQSGQNFANDLNNRFAIGATRSNSASASASVFSSSFDQQDEIAKLRSQQNSQNFTSDLNQRFGIGGSGSGSARESASVFEESARQSDQLAQKASALRAAIDPVAASQARLNDELAEYQKLASAALITTREMSEAEAIARARHEGVVKAFANGGRSQGLQNFQAANVAYQAQDTIVQAVGGASPGQIGLQQGTQLAGAFAGQGSKQALATLGTGLLSLLSPVNLLAIGFVTAGAAAIQFGSRALQPVKTMDDAVKAHADNVDLLRKRYGDLAEQVKISGSLSGSGFLDANIRANEQILRAVSRQEEKKYVTTLQSSAGVGGYLPFSSTNIQPKSLTGLSGGLADFQQPVNALLSSIRQGNPDLKQFQSSVDETFNKLLGSSENPDNLARSADAVKLLGQSFLTAAGSIKVLGDDGKETTQSLEPFSAAIARLKLGLADNSTDAFGHFIEDVTKVGQNRGIQNVADQVVVLGKGLMELNQQTRELDAKKLAIFNNIGPNGMLLSQGTTNQNDMGEYELYKSRERIALQRTTQSFDAQVAGVGARSPGERADAARKAAAAQYNNDETPGQRNQRINQAGQLAEVQAQKALTDAQRDRKMNLEKTVSDQQMEINLIGKTAGEAAKLRQEYQLTEQLRQDAAKNNTEVDQREIELIKQKSDELGKLTDQYNKAKLTKDLSLERDQIFRSPQDQQIASRLQGAGLPIDMQSNEANLIRQNLRTSAIKDSVTGFMSDFRQQLVSNGGKVGEAFGSSLKNAALSALSKIGDDAANTLSNLVVRLLTGTSGGATSTSALASTGGGLLGSIFGGKSSSASGIVQAANDNSPAAAMTGASGVQGQVWNFFAGKGLQPHQIAGIMGNVGAESAFNPLAKGDNGNALGLFQWNSRSPKMLNSIGGRQNLGDVNSQLNFAWSELQGPENKAFKALMSSKDVGGATAAFAGFERPKGFTWANPQGADNFTGRLNGAENALGKFGSTASQATQGVGQLGAGLNQLGTGLSQAGGSLASGVSAGGSSGGGLFGWLGNLFGGGTKGFDLGAGATAYTGAALPAFANGTDFSPGGTAMVGENGREFVNLPRGSQVIPNHRTEAMMNRAANANNGGGATDVNVGVAVDDDGNLKAYVKKVSKRHADDAVNSGLFNYSEGMRRQGIGALNARYASQKA
ncbi:phage tail tip lysozyme [Rhizobium sp. 23-156E]